MATLKGRTGARCAYCGGAVEANHRADTVTMLGQLVPVHHACGVDNGLVQCEACRAGTLHR